VRKIYYLGSDGAGFLKPNKKKGKNKRARVKTW
jgi:hypothetical protein